MLVLFAIAIPLLIKLKRFLNVWIYRKDIALEPSTMVLPERGTVTLKAALHKMTTQIGVYIWDMLLGLLFFSVLLTQIVSEGEMDFTQTLCGLVGIVAVALMGPCYFV